MTGLPASFDDDLSREPPYIPLACESLVDEETMCDRESRFRVERADADPSYGPAESCPEHLAGTIATLLEGLPIAATVTVHWDGEEN